jgi:hypothetical protein
MARIFFSQRTRDADWRSDAKSRPSQTKATAYFLQPRGRNRGFPPPIFGGAPDNLLKQLRAVRIFSVVSQRPLAAQFRLGKSVSQRISRPVRIFK